MGTHNLVTCSLLFARYLGFGSLSESETQCSIQSAYNWDVQSEVKFFDDEKQGKITMVAELKCPNHLHDLIFPNSHPHYGNIPFRQEKADAIMFEIGMANIFYVTTRIVGRMRVCLFSMPGWMIKRYRKSVYFLKDTPKDVAEKAVREMLEACGQSATAEDKSQNRALDPKYHEMKPFYIPDCTEINSMQYMIDDNMRYSPGDKLILQKNVTLGDSLEMWKFSRILFWRTSCLTNGTTCISKDNGTWLNTDMKTNLAVVVALDVDEIRRSSACTDKFRHYDSFTSLHAPRKHEYINCSLTWNRAESKRIGSGKSQLYIKSYFVIVLLVCFFF